MQRTVDPNRPDATDGRSTTEQGIRRLSSALLLGDHRRIEIEHNGEVYRLQITRQGKLILTK